MDLNFLQDKLADRGMEWRKAPTSNEFAIIEMAGEAGEVCNAYKKYMRHEYGMAGGEASLEPIAEEVADVIISAVLVAMKLGINLDETIKNKFNKTSEKNGLSSRIE